MAQSAEPFRIEQIHMIDKINSKHESELEIISGVMMIVLEGKPPKIIIQKTKRNLLMSPVSLVLHAIVRSD